MRELCKYLFVQSQPEVLEKRGYQQIILDEPAYCGCKQI